MLHLNEIAKHLRVKLCVNLHKINLLRGIHISKILDSTYTLC